MAAAVVAAVESDLERDLRDIGDKLSSPPSDAEELLSLLNLAENILWRVKQRPSDSTCGALHLIMKSLVAKDLMNHSDMDVKVALASCFSEIIRISAPADPFSENLMKAILRITVDALTDIDDLSSRSHGKRVSILETITEIHAFFMLLDLECNDLILEMFHHFLKTARQVDDGRVLSFMETMMTKLLNESNDILLSRLLDCVVKDIKDGLPIPSRLGEKVIGNCAAKLRPYLVELVRSNGASCNDYGDIIASICQEDYDTSELNKPNTSGECLITPVREGSCHIQGSVDVLDHQLSETNSEPEHKFLEANMAYDNQLSEGTFFNESPQESERLEQEMDCPNNSEAEKAFQETTRRSSRKIVKRKFFEEENCKTKKQKKITNKVDRAAKKILKKRGETCTSKSTRKLTKIELSDLQRSIIEKLTGELIIIDDLAGDQILKARDKDQSNLVDSSKATSRRKCRRESTKVNHEALDNDQSNLAENGKVAPRRKRRRKSTKVNHEDAETSTMDLRN